MKRKRPTTLEPISAAVIVIVSLHVAAVFGLWCWWQNTSSEQQRDARAAQLAWMDPGEFKSQVPAASPAPLAKAVLAATKTAQKPPAATPPKPPAEAAVQKATLVAAPPQQHQMEPVPNPATAPLFASAAGAPPKPSANRNITLRRVPDRNAAANLYNPPVPPMTSPTLMDIARLNTMRPAAVQPRPSDADAAASAELNLDTVDEAVNAAFLASWTAPPIESVPEGQREARLNLAIGKDGTVLKAQMSKFSGSHMLDQSILEAAAKVKKISTTLPANFTKESYDLELNFLLLP
jgi:outer membrane biosynthesis protein TonB